MSEEIQEAYQQLENAIQTLVRVRDRIEGDHYETMIVRDWVLIAGQAILDDEEPRYHPFLVTRPQPSWVTDGLLTAGVDLANTAKFSGVFDEDGE